MNRLPHRYLVFGLSVHSDFPLWAVARAKAPPDVIIRSEDADAGIGDPGEPDGSLADDIVLSWPRVARMRIRGGRDIVVSRGARATQDHLRQLVTGVGLGLALHQRGQLTLHASAVAIDGGAVLFAASKRGGKSTTAAAMQAAGYTILTDDIAAIETVTGRRPLLFPGPGSLNLWPDAAGHLYADFESWPRSSPFNEKRVRSASADPVRVALPVVALFVLDRLENGSETPVVQRLTIREAFLELLRHSYALRMVDDTASVPRISHQCASLAREVPVIRLRRSWSLDRLPDLVRCVETGTGALAGTGRGGSS